MKKVILSIVFVLIAQMCISQDVNFKADVLKLISISGADAQINILKPQVLKIIPDDKKENFSKEFDASVVVLEDKMAKIYMEIYTPEDVKGMIVFYESPIGKKMNDKAAELGQKSLQVGQDWGVELQGLIAKYKEVKEQNKFSVTLPK